MEKALKYGRLQLNFPKELNIDSIIYSDPEGITEIGPVFDDIPAEQVFDIHGYQSIEKTGVMRTSARYTPVKIGIYKWEALSGSKIILKGSFLSEDSSEKGFIEVSKKDSRYFAYSNGDCYIPVGPNMAGPDFYSLPAGMKHFALSGSKATPGAITYKRWLGKLSENGGNYIRIWLCNPYFNARTEIPGIYDYNAFCNVDRIVEICRKSGIKIKMTLEAFRTFAGSEGVFYKKVRDPETGSVNTDIENWFRDPRWNDIWFNDIKGYIARYWNDPVIMAWEPWNENDCTEASFDAISGFTERMLPRIKAMSPKNLVTNSLGSFDEDKKQEYQDAFKNLECIEYQQVHRYLDQGAPLEICREDPVKFSVDAVIKSRRSDKPCLLAETGAVNDRHSGPFRFYGSDHYGTIFNDVTYTPFFAGAAGTGQIWHWGEYVDTQNLWDNYRPFSEMIKEINSDEENFISEDIFDDEAYILSLKGKTVIFLYVRNKADRWDHVLRDGKLPLPISGLSIPSFGKTEISFFPLKGDEEIEVNTTEDGNILLPDFTHGYLIKMQ